ncbi:MAG: hypothetical protein RR060_08520 [Victivallaceae bacterium]
MRTLILAFLLTALSLFILAVCIFFVAINFPTNYGIGFWPIEILVLIMLLGELTMIVVTRRRCMLVPLITTGILYLFIAFCDNDNIFISEDTWEERGMPAAGTKMVESPQATKLSTEDNSLDDINPHEVKF